MYKLYGILTPLVLSVVTASRTLHPTPFKSCVFFVASVFLLLPLLLPPTFFVQSEIPLFQCYTSQQSQCDHRQELVIDFCKIFGLFFLLLLFSLIFSNVKHFFLVNLKSFFTFNIFLLLFQVVFSFSLFPPESFFKHHFLFYASSGLPNNTNSHYNLTYRVL